MNIIKTLNEALEKKYHLNTLNEATINKDYNLCYKGQGWTIYKILTVKGAKSLGKGTKWCISGKNGYNAKEWYDKHIKSGVKEYYVLISNTKDKWLYFNYGDIEQQKRRHTFYNKEDNRYTLFNISYILDGIPVDVLKQLPFLDKVDFNELINTQKEIRNGLIDGSTLKVTKDMTFGQTQSVAYEARKIIISKDVKKIQKYMFRDMGGIKEVVFEKGSVLQEIEDEAFTFTNLPYIKLPNRLEKIGKSAFRKGFDLNVEFEQSSRLKEIGDRAFEECTAMQELSLPETTNKIGRDVFKNCTALKEIKINGEYRPEIFKDAGLNDNTILNWIDCDIKETWRDIKTQYDKNKQKGGV